jgi:hypothetical protein
MSAARRQAPGLPPGERAALPARQEVALVDAAPAESSSGQEMLSHEEADDIEAMQAAGISARTAEAISKLTISPASLERARDVRQMFDAASDGDPAEGLLEQLVAGEVGIGHELQNLEGVSTALLVHTIENPALALQVARLAREIVSLSSAVRRRTENTLGAIAGLRAQRLLLAAQRGRIGG